jgi:SAM-dependent MidA family methyltransferase
MARANAAYYATHDPFADFTTAPEILQVFGEILGAWAAIIWGQLGQADPIILAEAGPGRGTLMADALRLTARVAPDFHRAAQIHFIETSPRLRAIQARAVPNAQWHDGLASLPGGPIILLANEFLDALPVRQFVRTEDGWAEHHVEEGVLHRHPAEPPPGAPPDAPPGSIFEIQPEARAFIAALATRIATQGGAALILDYGRAGRGLGDSLQAIRGGRQANPLVAPGETDLTVHVDFQAMAQEAKTAGATAWGPIPQGNFLGALGLVQRAQKLAAANPGRATALLDAAQRLAAPGRMGHLFKVLAITQINVPPPPGFET